MKEMIRNHGFSQGNTSYRKFKRKANLASTETNWRSRGESSTLVDSRRNSFFGRQPAAFGVEMLSAHDVEAWDSTVRSLGNRSASEGALLRYANTAVEDMTRSVREELGVDVARVNRRQIRKPSFLARLDIKHVSQ